jgi:uncharacterized membrane protein YphA (DoxX/SURF4 family)
MTQDSKGRKIGYWAVTALLSFFVIGSGVADLMGVEDIAKSLEHLGYPLHLMTLLGIAKLAAAVAILAPGFPRLKEWAYAGLVIDFGGGMWSHVQSGDPIANWGILFVLLALTFGSWFLRPSNRRLPDRAKSA